MAGIWGSSSVNSSLTRRYQAAIKRPTAREVIGFFRHNEHPLSGSVPVFRRTFISLYVLTGLFLQEIGLPKVSVLCFVRIVS